MSDYKLSAINPSLIPAIWPLVERMIEEPIEHSNGELDIRDMYERMIIGEMILITVNLHDEIVAVITMEKLTPAGGNRILNLTTVGGCDMSEWIDLVSETMDRIALDQGCNEIYIVGRPGWQKMLKSKGYEHIHTVMGRKVGG